MHITINKPRSWRFNGAPMAPMWFLSVSAGLVLAEVMSRRLERSFRSRYFMKQLDSDNRDVVTVIPTSGGPTKYHETTDSVHRAGQLSTQITC